MDLKARGLAAAPEIAVGDGAMGFWKALDEVFPGTRHQRCWQHKAANVLNKVPRSVQPGMKACLREACCAPDRAQAEAAVAVFAEKDGAKCPKAVECLVKDRGRACGLLRLPPPSIGTICERPTPSRACSPPSGTEPSGPKGALSQITARLMVFKLVMAASKTWRRLKGENRLPMVLAGVTFTDGVAAAAPDHRAA